MSRLRLGPRVARTTLDPPRPVTSTGTPLRAGARPGIGDAHIHSSVTCRRGGYRSAPRAVCRSRTHTATRHVPECEGPVVGQPTARSDDPPVPECQASSLTVRTGRDGVLGALAPAMPCSCRLIDVPGLRARARITSHFGPPMHPVWRRCSSVEYCPYAPSSRLASRAPRRPKMGTYSYADPTAARRPLSLPRAFRPA